MRLINRTEHRGYSHDPTVLALDFSAGICDTIFIYEMGADTVLRAAFAGYTFELIGCDDMHNADKFARFPSSDAPVDCRVEVTVQSEYLRPQGEPLMQAGDWRCYAHGDRKRIYHRYATLMIEATDDFSSSHLFFCDKMPMLETILYLQVQQMIGSFLLLHGKSLIHSAGLSLGDKGILLCGRSGVGKSTMTAHLQRLEESLTVLSEDMPAVMRENGGSTLCGTPLCGDDECCANGNAPLSHIVFLQQASHNQMRPLADAEAVYELLTVLPRAVYAPMITAAATDWSVALANEIPITVFENDGTEQAARMLLHELQNGQRVYI